VVGAALVNGVWLALENGILDNSYLRSDQRRILGGSLCYDDFERMKRLRMEWMVIADYSQSKSAEVGGGEKPDGLDIFSMCLRKDYHV